MKQIGIINRTYYFFDDMVNIKSFDSKLLKIDKNSYKSIDIFYIAYISKKHFEYVNIHSVNPLYLIKNKEDGFTEEKEGSKYLYLPFTDKNSEVSKKYAGVWNGIKNLIEKIDNEPGKYGKDYIKIKFSSDEDLPLDKPLNFHKLTIIIRSVFEENCTYYPQIYLHEYLYEV